MNFRSRALLDLAYELDCTALVAHQLETRTMQTFNPPPTAEDQKQLHRLYRQRMDETEPQFMERMSRDAQDLERKGFTLVRRAPKIGRNEPCPCGSGKKFKKCHINAPEAA